MMQTLVKANSGQRTQWLACCLILSALAALAHQAAGQQEEEQLTVESRQQKEASASENELADTIKYLEKLEKLDKYWSEVARPRFGRSEYKQRHPLGGIRFWPQQVGSDQQAQRQLQQQQEANFKSLLNYVNARMAKRYNSNAAY